MAMVPPGRSGANSRYMRRDYTTVGEFIKLARREQWHRGMTNNITIAGKINARSNAQAGAVAHGTGGTGRVDTDIEFARLRETGEAYTTSAVRLDEMRTVIRTTLANKAARGDVEAAMFFLHSW